MNLGYSPDALLPFCTDAKSTFVQEFKRLPAGVHPARRQARSNPSTTFTPCCLRGTPTIATVRSVDLRMSLPHFVMPANNTRMFQAGIAGAGGWVLSNLGSSDCEATPFSL